MNVRQKLESMGVQLPVPTAAVGAYVPAKRVGNLVYVSGQVPMRDGKLTAIGQVPGRCSVEAAKVAARQCAINALAAVNGLPGGVDQLVGVARVGAFVSCDASFTQQPTVANGASEFLIELFGDAGRHARAAVGANTLPLDAAVEVEFTFIAE